MISMVLILWCSNNHQADPTRATTKLHMDKSGAVNIMLHSERKLGGDHGAEWYIWPHESIAAISDVVRPGGINLGAPADAILSETYFLDADARQDAFMRSGYPPWQVLQKPGDAVFIPPRSPHQVCSHYICSYSFHVWPRSPILGIVWRLPVILSHFHTFPFWKN